METRYLESFVAVCEYGSFAEAARRLDVTPAALAARIKTLEEEIGTRLLTRAGRMTKPTEAGIKILKPSRQMIKEARSIQAIANNDDLLGELRMGVATSTLADLTPQLLTRLYRQHPTLRIYVESGASAYLYNRVVSRDIDAAIMAEPVHASPKGFEWTLLKEERLVLIAPMSMKGADPKYLLATQPFLRFDRSLRGGQAVESYLKRHGLHPQERLEIDMLVSIAYLVRDGVGVALVPDWSRTWLESIGVARLALGDDAPARKMGIFWAANGPCASLIDTLIDQARQLSD